MKTKFALPRKLLSGILAVMLLAVAIFPCVVSAAATEYNAGVAVSQADEYKTQWRFIPVGEDTYIFDKPVKAKVYRLQSTKSGLYLTYAGADADGKNVTLKTAPLDENNQGQLWSFILNWNTAGTGYNLLTKATGYGDYDFGACIYYDGSSSTNMRLSGALYWDAAGEATVMLNSNGATTVESLAGADGSFIATIQYRWPDPYLNEDYIPVDNGIDDPTVEPETPVSYGDVEFTSLNAGTKWTFTPAKKATAVFWAAGGEKEETFYSISVGDAFLTANYDENGVFTGLSMESRDKSNDGQHWCLDPFWTNGNNFGLCNLGGTVDGVIAQLTYCDGTFGMMSNVWTGTAGLAIKLDPRASDTNLYPLITNENGIGTAYICVGNGSTYLKLTALCDENRYNDTATVETKQVFGQAANYDVTEVNATKYTFNPIGTADYYNIDGTEVEKVLSNGLSTSNGVVYTISNGDKFLTANFGENESVTLTFETRDQANKNQQWMLYKMWGDDKYYGLISLGYTNEYETAGKEVACMVSASGNGFAVRAIAFNPADSVFLNDSSDAKSVKIDDLINENNKYDGSFVANLGMANSVSRKTLELDVFSATETVKIISNRAEGFEGNKTANNVAYLWKLTAVEKDDVTYYTMQNKLTGLYLTMHLGTIYLAERDEVNNNQLWKFVDCATEYGKEEGIYEIQCYTTATAINTIYPGGYDATVDFGEDDILFSNLANAGAIGGRAWTLSYNRTSQVVGDGMVCVINSFQWEDTANWDNDGTNYYLAAKDDAVSGKVAKYGDVNADDTVDILDLIAMYKLAIIEGKITQRANLNPATQDRGATPADLIILKKLILGVL